MEIVIKIPNFAWIEDIKDFKSAVEEYKMGSGFDHAIREALLLGTPLPNQHGRLIDADALTEKAPEIKEYLDVLAPTIIEGE